MERMTNTPIKIVMLLVVLLFTIAMAGKAQTATDYYNMFQDKKIHFSQIPEDMRSSVFWEMHKDCSYDINYIQEKGEFRGTLFECIYKTVVNGHRFNYRNGNYLNTFNLGTVKEESNSWPVAYRSADNNIVFYAEGMSKADASSTTVIHGQQLETVFAYFNRVRIDGQKTSLQALMEGLDFNKIEYITPEQFIYQKEKEFVVLSFAATYADKPTVVYTEPKYEIIGGQLMEINSGVNYEVRMFDVGSLALIDTKNLKTVPGTLLNLNGIGRPGLKAGSNHAEERTLYYYNSSTSSSYRDRWDQRIEILSQGRQPIYILNSSKGYLSLESQLIPHSGDIVFDIQETKDYICYCGSNTIEGYNNPFLAIIDKNSHEEIARYNGNKGKDRFFTNMYVLDDENVLLDYDNYYKDRESYEIVNIQTLGAIGKAKNWIYGEWKNESCGSIVEIYSDSIRIMKNNENGNILDAEKIAYKIDFVSTSEGKTLALIGSANEADYVYIDSDEEFLFYLSENGDMVYLEQSSKYTIEEQQKIAKKREENKAILQQDLTNGYYEWVGGQWKAELMGDIYLLDVDKDQVSWEIWGLDNPDDSTSLVCSRKENYTKDIHYEENEMIDDPLLALVSGFIYIDKENAGGEGGLYTFYDFDQRVDFKKVSAFTKAEEIAIQKEEEAQLKKEKMQSTFKYILIVLIPISIALAVLILLRRNNHKKANS